MANYLYNGVELPDINTVWTDKETYPYAVILYLAGVAFLSLLSTPVAKVNRSDTYDYCAVTAPFVSRHYVLSPYVVPGEWANETEINSEENIVAIDTAWAIGRLPTWSNHTIYCALETREELGYSPPFTLTDEVHFEKSEAPIPVGVNPPDPLSLVMGYRVGCAIRANR